MIDFETRFFEKEKIKERFENYVLGIDIGGTNTNLCVSGVKNNRPIFLFSLNFETKNLTSIIQAIDETINFSEENYNIKLKKACIGAPGVVSSDNKTAELTNIEWNVDSKKIIKKTNLESVYILNDFQVIGYGLNLLNKNDLKKIKKGKITKNENKAIIGPGTGLGKTILTYNKEIDLYIPIESEGGHADFPAQNKFEIELIDFVKKYRKISMPITCEELLSGRGLENIYYFLRNKKTDEENKILSKIDKSDDKARLISKYKNEDETCKKTFNLFTNFLARISKNFALDSLCTGGLYIAGGISYKNKEIFDTDDFQKEFTTAYKKSSVLKNIPIYLISNYDVSIYGACLCAIIELG